MATRKAITLVSGLFQEVNTPTDKLDFAGNTTADLSENTNLYFTNARARSAVSVTDSGGFGSLAYNSSTGVITYTGTSTSDVRGSVSGNGAQGLTYDSSSGAFGLANIPNSSLANSSLTIGSTAVGLGATVGTFAGLTSLASGTLIAGVEDAANAIEIGSGNITFEGSTADANEIILTAADATGSDKTLTLPNETGTILSTASSIANSNLANSTVTLGATSVALGATVTNFSGLGQLVMSDLIVGTGAGNANAINIQSGQIIFEGSTANDFETIISVTDPTADRGIVFPDAGGTVALLTSLSIASGSGLTYNSSTGEFSTNAIPNSKLANSSVTVGSTAIALGNSSTTLAGLSSVTSTAVVTNDSGFRIRNNSDNTKIGAFSSASITGGQTRTLTFPDADGTIATQAYVNSQISAEDLDVETDSGNFDVDLNSEALTIAGGTGIDSSGSGTTATIAIDSTVVTKTGSATLTNKTIALGSNTVSGTLAQFNTAVTDATLVSTTGSETLTNKTLTSPVLNSTISGTSIKDEDNMASDSASHLATQQSIKAYVDTEIAGVPQGDITAVTAGTGLSGGGTTGAVSLAIDATVATLTGSQTLTNKTIVLGNNTVSGALADGITATTQSASDNSTKVATTAYVDNQVTAGAVNEFADNVFRVKDNSDASKKLAFECSGISGSTTRTMTVPDANGTISTESFATAIAVALG